MLLSRTSPNGAMYPEIPVSFTPRQLQPHGKGVLRYPVGDSVGPTAGTNAVENGEVATLAGT